MTEKPLAEQFREGIAAVVEPLKSELRAFVSDEAASKLDPVSKDLTEIRTQLAQLEERGDIKPTDEKVRVLETRLTDAEEAIRVIRVSPALPGLPGKAAVDFRGAFIRDIEGLRQGVTELQGMNDRRSAVESRAISTSLFATGGRLPAEVADTFIDYLVEFQVALSRVQTRRMMGPEGHTDELTVAARKMRKATEGVAPAVANAIGTKRQTMNTIEVIWAEDLSLSFLEDNLMRANAEQYIARLLATQFGNDMNDLAWNGDEADTADPFRAINNGWITIAQGDAAVHDVSFDDTGVGDPASLETSPSGLLHAMSVALPFKYKGRQDLAFFVPVRFAEEYANQLSTRETALGDQVVVGGFPAMRYFGRQVISEPHLYDENADKAVLTPLGNLFFGVQRQMMVESEWQPRPRLVEYTISARTDFQIANRDAFVLGSNLPAGLRSA